MNDKPNAKQLIQAEIDKASAQGVQPTKIHIPPDLENQLGLLGSSEIGSQLASEFTVVGPREAIKSQGNKFFGLEVEWDADKLVVE